MRKPNNVNKPFALPTKKKALYHYIKRKEIQKKILFSRLESCNQFLRKAKELNNES